MSQTLQIELHCDFILSEQLENHLINYDYGLVIMEFEVPLPSFVTELL